MKHYYFFFLLLLSLACKKDSKNITPDTDIKGFSILEKVPGIWNGPVTSSTNIGDFPIWIVDFRPISSNQVSAKNELDSINDIFMSFFVVKYNDEYKVAFRNGGLFSGYIRNSYMICDSVSESSSSSFYRFSDPISGGNRVYTDVTFKDDSLIIHTYTNKFATLSSPVSHMHWRAALEDKTTTQSVIGKFGFPKKEITKDFTNTFDGVTEAVFYSTASDVYKENEQPYLGKTKVTVNVSNPATPNSTKKVLIIITAQPLFNGFQFLTGNLKFRSRYVLVPANASSSFTFNYMHPGKYYLNAVYDENSDMNFSSGDFMNSTFDIPFTLTEKGFSEASVTIDFEIP